MVPLRKRPFLHFSVTPRQTPPKNGITERFFRNSSCEPFFPLQHSKTPRNPNLSKICPDDCFSGFQSVGVFQFFDKFLTNLGPPDWNPERQSSGQILDKFGVRGVFECCKGKKGSQNSRTKNQPKEEVVGTDIPRTSGGYSRGYPLTEGVTLRLMSDYFDFSGRQDWF